MLNTPTPDYKNNQLKRNLFIKKQQNRRQEPENNNKSISWLITYADLMAIMLTFFILIFSLSETNPEKTSQISTIIRASITNDATKYNTPQIPNSKDISASLNPFIGNVSKLKAKSDDVGQQQQQTNLKFSYLTKLEEEIKQAILINPLIAPYKNQITVGQDNEGIIIHLTNSLENPMFEPYKSKVRVSSLSILKNIVPILQKINYPIKITGHNSKQQNIIGNEIFALSYQRALNVMEYLTKYGLEYSKIFSIEGRADKDPIVFSSYQNLSNDRVSLYIIINEVNVREIISKSYFQ